MEGYDYTTAGFDGFLSRSIDSTQQVNLDSTAPPSQQFRFDSAQISGLMGDTFQVGPVRLTKHGILMSDDNGNDILLLGDDQGN